MERDGMLRHLAFFEELGRMDEADGGWRSVSAGLVVMRLVDAWIADGPTASRVDSWAVSAVREAVAQIAETTPIKRILTSVVDVMTSSTAVDMHALCPRLMAYGQALEYEAKWSLAADVYATIVAHAHPVEDSDLAVAGHLQLAFCLRTMGDLDAASCAYSQASRIAAAANDMLGVLRGRLGDAKIATARGNMPQADAILQETIARAEGPSLADVRSRALTDRAYIAGLSGHHDRAIRFSYDAFEITQTERERDRILTNIATAFRFLGLVDAARDAYLVIASTAQEAHSRWLAELNLMELAAHQGIELQFDRYRRDLESADLHPILRITYLLHVGRGYHALGRAEVGIPYLERAVDMASKFGFNQIMFEAEAALASARQRAPVEKPEPAVVEPEVTEVARAIQKMRVMAGA